MKRIEIENIPSEKYILCIKLFAGMLYVGIYKHKHR